MLILLGCLVAVLLCLPGGYVDTLNFNIKQTGSDSTLRVRSLCDASLAVCWALHNIHAWSICPLLPQCMRARTRPAFIAWSAGGSPERAGDPPEALAN